MGKETEKPAKGGLTCQNFSARCGKIAKEIWPPDAAEKFISVATLIKDKITIGALVLFALDGKAEPDEIQIHLINHQRSQEVMILPRSVKGREYAHLLCDALKDSFKGLPKFSCWVNPTSSYTT